MPLKSVAQLLLLAAIWGSSFLFMRVAAPALGPSALIFGRVAFAALFLLAIALLLKKSLHFRQNWRFYMVIGLLNSALPFLLFAYAAQTISASLLSVLNATAPIWGVLIAALWQKQELTKRKSAGLLLGMTGVGVLVGFDHVTLQEGAPLAIACALGAALCYGIASTYAHTAKKVAPFATAHGSMWCATAMLVPVVLFFPLKNIPTLEVSIMVITLGVVCSGVAYLLYFRLVEDLGAPSALTVTFLIPLFGVLWGHLFLNEVIGWHTLIGGAATLSGTALVTGFSLKGLLARRPKPATL